MWRRYLRFWGPSPAEDIEDEFSFHIESAIDELIEQGCSPEEARREARRMFGPQSEVRRECDQPGGDREALPPGILGRPMPRHHLRRPRPLEIQCLHHQRDPDPGGRHRGFHGGLHRS